MANQASAMTSPSPSQDHHQNKSRFQPTVCLADWWLIRAENDFQGRRLAVAGYSSREKQALRVFSSAPILKRYDVLTLETSDGICVILSGFMNKARTLENRFPSEVCDHFIFGFPPYWKDYDKKFISNDSSSDNMLGVDPVKKLSPQFKVVADESGQLHEDSHDHSSKIVMSDEKSKSASAACVSGGTNRWNSEGSGLRKHTVKSTVTESGSCSVEDECERTFETPIQNEDQKMIKMRDKQKKKHKATSLPGAGAVTEQMFETPIQCEDQKVIKIRDKQNKKHKATILRGAGAAAEQMSEAKEYKTPEPRKAECDTSNKFMGFTRSRSGRLLVPPLKFWCNQRVIYDLDRTVTGIQECVPVEQPRKGSCRSEPQRKRRNKM